MEDSLIPIALLQRSYDQLNTAGEEFRHLSVQDLKNTNNEVQLQDLAENLRAVDQAAVAVVELASAALEYNANAYRQTTDKLMFKSVVSTVR